MLNIGQVIYELRKKNNITQEQLANVVGVSIPAISKWENGTTYPDITSLPVIARYFNVSIDELLDYKIELSKEEMETFLLECQTMMTTEPFDTIVTKCEQYLREHPNSELLKLSVGSFYMMGMSYYKEEDSIKRLIEKAISLLEDTAKSSDSKIAEQSYFILASLYGMNEQEDKAEETLLKIPKIDLNRDDLLIPIYIRQERFDEARKMIQTNLFKQIQSISLYLSNFQSIAMKENDQEFAEDLLKMDEGLMNTFNVQSLFGIGHTMGAMNFYASLGNEEKTVFYFNELVTLIDCFDGKAETKLFESFEYLNSGSKKHLAEILLNLLEIEPKLNCIKTHSSYPQAVEKLHNIM